MFRQEKRLNKYLHNLEVERRQRYLRQNLQRIKNRKQRKEGPFMFSSLEKKRRMVNRERKRLLQITWDNLKISRKIHEMMVCERNKHELGTRVVKNYREVDHRAIRQAHKKRDLMRTTFENLNLLHRLEGSKSHYETRKIMEGEQARLAKLEMVCEFPLVIEKPPRRQGVKMTRIVHYLDRNKENRLPDRRRLKKKGLRGTKSAKKVRYLGHDQGQKKQKPEKKSGGILKKKGNCLLGRKAEAKRHKKSKRETQSSEMVRIDFESSKIEVQMKPRFEVEEKQERKKNKKFRKTGFHFNKSKKKSTISYHKSVESKKIQGKRNSKKNDKKNTQVKLPSVRKNKIEKRVKTTSEGKNIFL